MTANLTITIDERNNVLKVPNAALRFTPIDASGQRIGGGGSGAGNGGGQRRQGGQAQTDSGNSANGSASPSQTAQPAQGGGQAKIQAGTPAGMPTGTQAGAQQGQRNFAPASAPVLEGQTRIVWVLGQDGKLQSRRIKVGLTDGVSTEVVEGNLQEGEMAVTGQTLTSASKAQSSQTPAPGFGGAPRTGGAPGGGRRP
jgi:HlyD family secretion protein